MAMITTDGAEVDLGDGVTRRFIVKADINSEGDLLPASLGRARIVYGQLDLSAATDWEIKCGSALKAYGKAGGASRMGFVFEDQLISDGSNPLKIESGSAAELDGYIDYILLGS